VLSLRNLAQSGDFTLIEMHSLRSLALPLRSFAILSASNQKVSAANIFRIHTATNWYLQYLKWHMTKKLLNFLLLVSFQFGYLEWGKNNGLFIFKAEQEIFSKALSDLREIVHPFILIPLLGMILLVITLFQKLPGKRLTLSGLACLSVLMLLLFFIGIFNLDFKILLSTIPFIVIGVIILLNNKKSQPQKAGHNSETKPVKLSGTNF
jgi:hypothetical protein